MAYNNNYRNNNWNNNYYDDRRRNDRGYNNNRGSWGNYDDRDRMNDTPRPFEINEQVIHKVTGIRLIVINYGREQIECRKPDLTSDYFYAYELAPLPESTASAT